MEAPAIREFFYYFLCQTSQLIFTRFVVVSVLNTRQQTTVSKRTLNPTYNPKDASFDFPIYLSLADKLGVVELVVWDKDMLTKEYLGEVALPLDDWFIDKQTGKERSFGFGQPGNEVSLYPFTPTSNQLISVVLIALFPQPYLHTSEYSFYW